MKKMWSSYLLLYGLIGIFANIQAADSVSVNKSRSSLDEVNQIIKELPSKDLLDAIPEMNSLSRLVMGMSAKELSPLMNKLLPILRKASDSTSYAIRLSGVDILNKLIDERLMTFNKIKYLHLSLILALYNDIKSQKAIDPKKMDLLYDIVMKTPEYSLLWDDLKKSDLLSTILTTAAMSKNKSVTSMSKAILNKLNSTDEDDSVVNYSMSRADKLIKLVSSGISKGSTDSTSRRVIIDSMDELSLLVGKMDVTELSELLERLSLLIKNVYEFGYSDPILEAESILNTLIAKGVLTASTVRDLYTKDKFSLQALILSLYEDKKNIDGKKIILLSSLINGPDTEIVIKNIEKKFILYVLDVLKRAFVSTSRDVEMLASSIAGALINRGEIFKINPSMYDPLIKFVGNIIAKGLIDSISNKKNIERAEIESLSNVVKEMPKQQLSGLAQSLIAVLNKINIRNDSIYIQVAGKNILDSLINKEVITVSMLKSSDDLKKTFPVTLLLFSLYMDTVNNQDITDKKMNMLHGVVNFLPNSIINEITSHPYWVKEILEKASQSANPSVVLDAISIINLFIKTHNYNLLDLRLFIIVLRYNLNKGIDCDINEMNVLYNLIKSPEMTESLLQISKGELSIVLNDVRMRSKSESVKSLIDDIYNLITSKTTK